MKWINYISGRTVSPDAPGGTHMKQMGMLIGIFELNPVEKLFVTPQR